MQTKQNHPASKQKKFDGKKLLNVVALGAFVAMPVLGTAVTGEAQPRNDKRYDNNRRNDNRRNNDRGRNDNDWRNNNRGRNDNDWRNNNRRDQYRTFTGTVLDVGNKKFDARINGISLNVLVNSSLPRGLSRGDVVRIYGVRDGNRIRNANVSIIRNR